MGACRVVGEAQTAHCCGGRHSFCVGNRPCKWLLIYSLLLYSSSNVVIIRVIKFYHPSWISASFSKRLGNEEFVFIDKTLWNRLFPHMIW